MFYKEVSKNTFYEVDEMDKGSIIDPYDIFIKIEGSFYPSDEQAKECKSGELSWFKPNQWGNEQLPLTVAGAYCDFNYPIMSNNSGVICVFTNKRMNLVN